MQKSAFNAEEWAVVVNAPALAALTISAADRGGSVRESVAMSKAYAQARGQDNSVLLHEIVTSAPSLDPASRPKSPDELRETGLSTLRRAVEILNRLADDADVVAYKRFVYGVADAVARAHKEGGFLGVGGSEVSANERAALDAIEHVFDTV